jgi:hypothetical protein
MFIEKRLRPEDPWQMDENHTYIREYPDEFGYLKGVSAKGRDYALFAKLAGVRGSSNIALYPRRGIPNDTSEEVQAEADQPDWHSHHWLSLEEFKECLVAAKYDLLINKSTDAYYDWEKYSPYDTRPEDFTTIVNYCEQWILNEAAEAQLLNRTDVIPEVRIIFWFDN